MRVYRHMQTGRHLYVGTSTLMVRTVGSMTGTADRLTAKQGLTMPCRDQVYSHPRLVKAKYRARGVWVRPVKGPTANPADE